VVAQIDRRIPASGVVVSMAHKMTGQGDEAYFMSAMLASELLRWHGYVQPRPQFVALAKRIVDHLVAEQDRRAAACLPYLSSDSGCAADLAGYYVWPALVLWQETGDTRYRTFAMEHMAATSGAFVSSVKQFNQTYSTGAQSVEALLAGVPWR
jgi:hypothetical protein